MPRSTLRAVLMPGNDTPSSTRVIATASCIPVRTVWASSTPDIAAIFASIRRQMMPLYVDHSRGIRSFGTRNFAGAHS
jgi:hypothetical protein